MSIFGNYFRQTLRWMLIDRPGPIAALALGAAKVLDNVREPIFWLRNQFLPRSCDETRILDHAQARGIRKWPGETAEQYRGRVVTAWAWHRLGGLHAGLPKILEYRGYPGTEMINLGKENYDRWAEFEVELSPPPEGYTIPELYEIRVVANDQKPARSKCAALRISSEISIELIYAAITQITQVMTIGGYIEFRTAVWQSRPDATFDSRPDATFDSR